MEKVWSSRHLVIDLANVYSSLLRLISHGISVIVLLTSFIKYVWIFLSLNDGHTKDELICHWHRPMEPFNRELRAIDSRMLPSILITNFNKNVRYSLRNVSLRYECLIRSLLSNPKRAVSNMQCIVSISIFKFVIPTDITIIAMKSYLFSVCFGLIWFYHHKTKTSTNWDSRSLV